MPSEVSVAVRLRNARQYERDARRAAKATRSIGAAAMEAGAVGARGAKRLDKMAAASKRLQTTGMAMSRHLTLPMVGLGVVAGKMAIDYSDAMNQIETQAGGSRAEVRKLSKDVLDFARSGKSSEGPEALAKGLFRIESAGFRGAKAMDALRASEELASVGRSDMEQTTTVLVAALRTGIKGTKDFQQATGLLNATVGAGNMRMEDLVGALSTGVLPSAKAVGLSLQDVGAALATLTAQGMPAQAAATRLRMNFSQMVAPTEKAKKALKDIGLGPKDLAETMQKKGLLPALKQLRGHMDGLSKVEKAQVVSAIFGGGKSSAGITVLLNSLGDLGKRYDQIGKKSGSFGKALESTQKEPAERLKAAWAQLQATLIDFGGRALPVVVPWISKAANVTAGMFEEFQKLPKPLRLAVGGFVALAAAMGPIMFLAGGIIRGALGMWRVFMALWKVYKFLRVAIVAARLQMVIFNATLLANPIGLIIVAVVALVAGFVLLYLKVKWFRNFVQKVWPLLVPVVLALLGPIAAIGFAFIMLRTKASGATRLIRRIFNALVGYFRGIPGRFTKALSGTWDGLKSGFRAAVNWIIGAWNSLEFKLPGFDPPGPGPKFGGITIGTPDIPKLAAGGNIIRPGTVLVGDRGPELLHLNRGAQVEPLGPRGGGFGVIQNDIYLDKRKIAEAVAQVGADQKARR